MSWGRAFLTLSTTFPLLALFVLPGAFFDYLALFFLQILPPYLQM